MKSFKGGRQRQRGVALMIALILVALATVLATKLSFDGFLELRRTTSMMAAEQALHFGLGAEALAADVLMQDAQTSPQYTTLAGRGCAHAGCADQSPIHDVGGSLGAGDTALAHHPG